ncbi:MAG: MFS transporter [Anaerolineae bacterium]|nr:MFS transporter [Anaerolineae bacterium]
MASLSQVHAQPAPQAQALAALRYPNFRLYFIGQLVSLSGTWMQNVAQGWLIFNLTKSELWLGVVACAAGLPSLILSPFAGVLVDRIPRRKILLVSQTVQMILAFILTALAFANIVEVWHVVVLAFILGVTNAIDAPSRQAIIVDLVGKDNLTSGITLNSIMFNTARVFGPAAAGIALVKFGPAWCFFLNGVSFIAVILMLWIMHVESSVRFVGDFAPLERLKEGLQYARRHSTIAPLLLLAGITSFLTINITTLLPAFADAVLHSPKVAYSSMTTAVGAGAVVAGILMSVLARRFGRGRVVFAMVVFVPIVAMIVSFVTDVNLAVFLMGLYGFGIILEFVTVNTLIQSEVPDEFRGRVMSLYTLTFFGVAPFGALALGFLAQAIGTPLAMAIYAGVGGLLCIYVMLRSPKVRALP